MTSMKNERPLSEAINKYGRWCDNGDEICWWKCWKVIWDNINAKALKKKTREQLKSNTFPESARFCMSEMKLHICLMR